jgi:CubicO group peptidase (beta-lactamase class C family)
MKQTLLKKHKQIFVFIFILLFTANMAAHSTDPSDTFKPIKETIDELIREDLVPGIQYIILNKSKILFAYAAGWADIEKRAPMTLDTPTMFYSFTKVLTTAAILKLMDQGKLGLDDPLRKHLPHVPYPQDTTLRRMLSHSSGIPEPDARGWIHFRENHNRLNRKNMLIKILEENPDLAYKPGEKRQYTNLGMALLGEVIEKLTGLSYENYMTKEIFAPLNINPKQMGFFYQQPTNQARGYINRQAYFYQNLKKNMIKGFPTNKLGKWEWITKFWNMNFPAHGGVIGSSRELTKFLQDQLKEKSAILSPIAKKLFYSPQYFNNGSAINSALGWRMQTMADGKSMVVHGGGGLAYRADIAMYPEHGIARILLFNCTRLLDRSAYKALTRLYLPQE